MKSLHFYYRKIIEYTEPCSEEQLLWTLTPTAWSIKLYIGFLPDVFDAFQQRIPQWIDGELTDVLQVNEPEQRRTEDDNRSIEWLLSRLKSSYQTFNKALQGTETEQWHLKITDESVHSPMLDSIRALTAYLTNVLDAIYLNLQRHDPWLKPEDLQSPEADIDTDDTDSVSSQTEPESMTLSTPPENPENTEESAESADESTHGAN